MQNVSNKTFKVKQNRHIMNLYNSGANQCVVVKHQRGRTIIINDEYSLNTKGKLNKSRGLASFQAHVRSALERAVRVNPASSSKQYKSHLISHCAAERFTLFTSSTFYTLHTRVCGTPLLKKTRQKPLQFFYYILCSLKFISFVAT